MSSSSIRTVWLLGLAALLGGAACDDGGGASNFSVNWSLAYVGDAPNTVGARTTCDLADTPTVELSTISHQTNQQTVDVFPCTAPGGVSRVLPPGDYEVAVALKNRTGKEVSRQEGTFSIIHGETTPLEPLTFLIQSFVFDWTLARGQVSLGCSDVGAEFVNLNTRLNSEDQVTYSFPCTAGSGATPALRLGTYSVGIDLVKGDNTVLWRSDLMTLSIDDNKRADLGHVMFTLP